MRRADEPYCRQCGYSLVGLIESSKCPECGRPIIEVLVRDCFPGRGGVRYQSDTRMFGLPLVSIAYGASGSERLGKPVGVVAIGDLPRGIIAIGGRALGVVAMGGFACGVISLGGFSLGALAIGGFSVGVIAIGGFALGGLCLGGTVGAVFKGVGGRVLDLWP